MSRIRKWAARTAVGLAAAGLLTLEGYSTYRAVDNYYTGQVEERVYKNITKRDPNVKVRPVIYRIKFQPLRDKIKYIRHLENAERCFEKNIDEFVEYLRRHPEEVEKLTEQRREYSGLIKRNQRGFGIDREKGQENDITDTTLRYIDEIINYDFTHKDDLVLYMSFFDDFGLNLSKEAPDLIRVLEYDNTYEHLPAWRKRQIEEQRPDVVKKLKEASGHAKDAFKGISEVVVGAQTGGGLSYDDLMKIDMNGFFASWHNHPKDIDPEEYEPSKTDEASTFILGPNVVFVQIDETIHVYGVNRGMTKEIYTTKIN